MLILFSELKEIESNIREGQIHRYFDLDGNITIQEKIISDSKTLIVAMSGDDCLEWMVFEDVNGDWVMSSNLSTMGGSDILTDSLLQFATLTGYIKLDELRMSDDNNRGILFNDNNTDLRFADTKTRHLYKGSMVYQIYHFYYLTSEDQDVVKFIKFDKVFQESDELKVMINRCVISIDHKYDFSTFDMIVYPEGCLKIVEEFAKACEKKHKIKLVADTNIATQFKGKTILYLQDALLDINAYKYNVDKFERQGVHELVVASFITTK